MTGNNHSEAGDQGNASRDFWSSYEFDRSYAGSLPKRAWNRLRGHQNQLISLSEVKQQVNVAGQHDKGMATVPVASITGSEGRSQEFNDRFQPLQKHSKRRWISIAAAQQQGKILPPVDLIKVGQVYFVRDGHHRVSVANEVGQMEIDAHVSEWDVACPIEFRRPELAKVCQAV